MKNNKDTSYKADILVVDDTHDNLRLLSKLLIEHGYYVRPVSDGKKAISAIQDQAPDLILLDIMMPGMDGYEVCRRLKAQETTRDIPIIFISALNETFDKVKAFSIGGRDYISKPFQEEEVLARVKTHIELHYAQEALMKNEKKYRDIVEGFHEGHFFYSHGIDRVFTYFSPSVQKVLGYRPEEIVGQKTLLTDSPINDGASIKTDLCIKGQAQPSYIVETPHKDGGCRLLEVSEVPVFDKEGNVSAVDGIAHDVTEHKRAEEALKKSERLLAETQRIAHLGSWEFDIATEEIKWSDETFRIAGMEIRDKLTLQEYLSIVHPDDLPLLEQALEKSIAQKAPYELELRHLRPDGTYNQTLTRGKPVIKDNEVVKFVGSVQDIAERKRMEEELKFHARTDMLTGIANRRAGIMFLNNQVQLAKRNKDNLCVCFVDINDLKNVNDTHGHEEGDEAIRTACETMKESLRESDFICRMGGDEFLIVFPQCSIKSASEIWKRVETRLEAQNKENVKPYTISLSHGFAECGPENMRSSDEMVSIADQEMYKNKHR